jgi:hypothetical protein
MKRKHLAMAGTLLIGIGAVQVAGALYFCWKGGLDGVLSPVAAVAAVWPVAGLLVFLGGRLRKVSV